MSTISCPFCQHFNPAGAKFCNECGSPVGLKPCPRCEAISDLYAEQCHQCGLFFDAAAISAAEPSAYAEVHQESQSTTARAVDTQNDVRARSLHIPESLSTLLDGSGMPVARHEPGTREADAREVAHFVSGTLPETRTNSLPAPDPAATSLESEPRLASEAADEHRLRGETALIAAQPTGQAVQAPFFAPAYHEVEPPVDAAHEASDDGASDAAVSFRDEDRAAPRERYRKRGRSSTRVAALGIALIAIGVGAYFFSSDGFRSLPQLDLASIGKNLREDAPRIAESATASGTNGAATPAESAPTVAQAPVIRATEAPSQASPSQAPASQPPEIEAPAASRDAPAAASRVRDTPATEQPSTERRAQVAAAQPAKPQQVESRNRAPRKQVDASAAATQRLIERDLGPFMRKEGSGAAGAIN